MKKIVLMLGLAIGAVLCLNMIIMVNRIYTNTDFKPNDIIGWVAMVTVFSMIFFGVRQYRNKDLNGFISFGEAFKTGFLIALVASTMYVVVWLFYYYLFVPDFIDVYIKCVLKQTPVAELPAKVKELDDMKEMYKNPVFVILLTYMEVLPVGLVVALVSAFILKKENKIAVA